MRFTMLLCCVLGLSLVLPVVSADGKTTTLTLVSDAAGAPLAGVSVGRLATGDEPAVPKPVGLTDADGRLVLEVDPAEWTAFCATGPGFAPKTFGFWGAAPKAHEVRLEPAAIRRGRVVKSDGSPAGGATVEVLYPSIDAGPGSDGQHYAPFSLVQVYLADEQGRFVLKMDPSDWSGAKTLRARDDAGHVAEFDWLMARTPANAAALEDGSFSLKLAPPKPAVKDKKPDRFSNGPTTRPAPMLTLRLNVVDDETGAPVRGVRVTPGAASSPDQNVNLRPDDALTFTDEPIEWALYNDAWAYVLRVRAPGYAAKPTRLIKASEKAVEETLRLRKAKPLALSLKDADGKPAAGALVYLATPTQVARVPLLTVTPVSALVAATADGDGVAMVNLPDEPCRAAVVHGNGWAEIDFTKGDPARRDVTLTRWASVSITLGDGRPSSGYVGVQSQSFYSTDADCYINWDGFGSTDERGVFVQHRCKSDATLLVDMSLGTFEADPARPFPKHFSVETSKPFTPGEHRDYNVFAGRGGFKATLLDIPGKSWEGVWLKRTAGPPAKAQPAAGESRPITPRNVWLEVSPDGVIACGGLQPGQYVVRATASAGDDDKAPSVADGEFTIGDDTTTVDLGTLSLKGPEKLAFDVGDAAPELKSTTLDGHPFDLAALRGKWVLLDFWGTWCGFCIAEEPTYQDAFEGWGADGRLEMVSLAVDDTPEQVKEHLKTHDLPWTHVVLGDRQQTDVPERFGVSGYPTVLLLSPEGKLVVSDLRGGKLRDALAKHLGPPSPPR